MFRFYAIVSFVLWSSVAHSQDTVDINILYDGSTGKMQVETNLGDEQIGLISIVSDSGIFTGERAKGIYDQYVHMVQFPRGKFLGPDIDLGPIASPGLSLDFLEADLCVESNTTIGSLTMMGQPQQVTNEQCSVPRNPSRPVGVPDKSAVLHYNSDNGNLFIDVGENAWLTTLELTSPQGIFTGDPANHLGSVWDVDSDHKIFKMQIISGFDDTDFGNVVASGLTNNEFVSSLCVAGSWSGGGGVEAEYQFPGAGRVPIVAPGDGSNRCRGQQIKRDLNVAYNPEFGHFTVSIDDVIDDEQRAEGVKFKLLQVTSKSGVFIGMHENLDGPNDVFSSRGFIKQESEGFSEFSLAAVVKPGIDANFLLKDISIDAILSDNSTIGKVRLVPEPSGLISLTGVFLCIACRRRGGGRIPAKGSKSPSSSKDKTVSDAVFYF